ncbi:hypothetical protein D9M68_359580 [compost metagenome]
MFSLKNFLFCPFIMKTEYGYSIFINNIRVDLTIVIFTGNRSSAAGHSHSGSIKAALVFFKS